MIPVFSSETTKYRITGEEIATLTIINTTGDIEVLAHPSDSIKVEVTKKGKSRYFDEVKIDFTKDINFVIETVYEKPFINVEVDYKIKVPEHILIALKNVTGDIMIDGVLHVAAIDLVTGDVEISDSKIIGEIFVVTGDIEVDECEQIEKINVITGDIKIEEVMEFQELKTQTGDIDVSITSENPGSSIITTTGDIVVYISSTQLELELYTLNGKINNHGVETGNNGKILMKTITGDIDLFKERI
ncbi:MAG: hypothetical protein MJB14_18605 [Spirochaetes bacterium]|nr:hypothetical protein [Spirochaetota bacterium]